MTNIRIELFILRRAMLPIQLYFDTVSKNFFFCFCFFCFQDLEKEQVSENPEYQEGAKILRAKSGLPKVYKTGFC